LSQFVAAFADALNVADGKQQRPSNHGQEQPRMGAYR